MSNPTPPPATVFRWGYAGVYPAAFGVWQGDSFANRLRFAPRHGFVSTSTGVEAVADPARFETAAAIVAETGIEVALHPRIDFFHADAAVPLAEVRQQLAVIERVAGPLKVPGITVCVGAYHRFMRSPSLADQLARLRVVLRELAAGCRALGLPCGIENHGDYYVSDLVPLCEEIPGLGLFLDTGNCYLIGEASVPAGRLGAPYVMGTHFKDHVVHPDPKLLHFVVEGAALGDGDVGLREIHAAIRRHATHPEKLLMQWELVPPRDGDPWEALRRSWDFVRSLS